MADQKLTALTEISAPSLADIFYIVGDPAGTPASDKISGMRLAGLLIAQQCQGRLTTESGVPVSTGSRTAQGTLYWTPSTPQGIATASGLVGFYDGTRYVVKSLTQLSLSLTVTSGKNYDVFLDYNSGTPQLALSAAWTNDTTRADALAMQGPFVVKSGSATLRWVGTIRASGTNVTADSFTQRFVANAYNAVVRAASKSVSSTHSYASSTYRYWGNNSANIIEFILANPVTTATILLTAAAETASSLTADFQVAPQLDWTNGLTGEYNIYISNPAAVADLVYRGSTSTRMEIGLGYHYIAAIEGTPSSTSATYYTVDWSVDLCI